MASRDLNFNINVRANVDQANREVAGLFDRIKESQDPAYWDTNMAKMSRIFNEKIAQMNSYGNDFAKSISGITNNSNVSIASLTKFGGTITTIIGTLTLYKKALDGCLKYCTDIAEGFGNVAVGGIELFVDGINNLIGVIDNAIEKIQEFSEIGIESQQGYFTLYNYLGTAGDEIVSFTDKLEQVYGMDSSKLVGGMRGILGMVSNMNLELEQANDTIKAFTMFGQDLSAFSGYSVEEVVGQLESAINLGSIRLTSPIVRALDMKKEDLEVFRQLNSVEERAQFLLEKGEKVRGTYEKWLETSAGKVETYNNRVETLMNSIGRLVTGLYAQVAPLLSVLTELITHLVDGLAELFYVDLKDSEENQAEDYYNDIADSLDNVAESANKAQNNLGKFDEVNNVNKNTSSSGGSVGNTDWSFLDDWLKDIEEKETYFTKLRDEIIRLWTEKNYIGIGQLLAKEFKSLLTDIDWNDIENKIKNIGTIIAQLFNGFTDPDLGGAVGDTLVGALNTGFGFLYSFAKTYNFGQLGDSLLEAWYSFWNGLDTSDFAGAVSEWFWGVIETAFSFTNGEGKQTFTLEDVIAGNTTPVSGQDKRTSMGGTIAQSINRFFLGVQPDENGNYTLEDVVAMGEGKGQGFSDKRSTMLSDTIIGIIDLFFDNIQTYVDTLEYEDIKDTIIKLIKKIVTGLVENSEDWGKSLNKLIMEILDLSADAIEEADSSGIVTAVSNFVSGLNIGEILVNWILLEIKKGWIKFKIKVNTFIQSLTGFAEIIGKILGTITGAITKFVTNPILSGLNAGVSLGTGGKYNNIVDLGKDFIGTLKIKKAATGGLVMGNTLVEVGEGNKKEAIVPLEQNTGWIKTLAKELGGQIKINNQSSTGGSVTLDMRGYQKNFYTRNEMIEFADMVVEALKVRGYSAQIAY